MNVEKIINTLSGRRKADTTMEIHSTNNNTSEDYLIDIVSKITRTKGGGAAPLCSCVSIVAGRRTSVTSW
jgi:predicted Zn-ribbon and HTH transcriptional regulator